MENDEEQISKECGHCDCKDTETVHEQVKEEKTISMAEDEYTKVLRDLDEYKNKYYRSLAESENMRKRLQKEKVESQTFAIQSVVLDFLQPLDHLEGALKHAKNASAEVKNWAIGFEMILSHFKQALEDNGIKSFVSMGTNFDPHRHEAIEIVVTEEFPEGTVVEECMKGYEMSQRVIRPAKVKVATGPQEKNDKNEEK